MDGGKAAYQFGRGHLQPARELPRLGRFGPGLHQLRQQLPAGGLYAIDAKSDLGGEGAVSEQSLTALEAARQCGHVDIPKRGVGPG